MLSNPFMQHQQKPTSFLRGEQKNQKRENSFEEQIPLKKNRFKKRNFVVSKMTRKNSSDTDTPRPSETDTSNHSAPKEFSNAKIPLEGIEFLMERDKLPNELGKKMDKKIEKLEKNNSQPPASRFLNKKNNNDSNLEEILSEAESLIEKRPRRKLKLRRNKDRIKDSHRNHSEPSLFINTKKINGIESGSERIQSDSPRSSLDSVSQRSSASQGSSKRSYSSGYESGDASSEASEGSSETGSEISSEADSEIKEEDPRWKSTSRMSREEILAEKEQLLYEYGRLSDNGYKSGIPLNTKTSLDIIRNEVRRLKKLRSVQRSIRFQRKILVSFASGLEYCNKKFNPYKLSLDGWSGDVLDNVGDYDEVFEELYEKYHESVEMAPELKLMAMVGGSGLMFHLSNSLFSSSTPEMNDILMNNPHIMAQIQGAALNQMANQNSNDPLFGMMMSGLGMRQQNAQRVPRASFQMPQMTRTPTPSNVSQNVGASVDSVPDGQGLMKGPEGVDDILDQLNKTDASQIGLVSDVEDMDDKIKEVKTTRRKKTNKKQNNVIDLDM
jgi:hypothetical protein